MIARLAMAAALLATALPAAAAPRCKGKISGAVRGSFTCQASVFTKDDTVYFQIAPDKPIEGIPSYAPGAFELPDKPAAGAYTLDTLGSGRASVAAEGGTLYTATKTSSQRGEVQLTFRSVRPAPKAPGAWLVRGRYRAVLIPAGAGKTGQVVVDVEF